MLAHHAMQFAEFFQSQRTLRAGFEMEFELARFIRWELFHRVFHQFFFPFNACHGFHLFPQNTRRSFGLHYLAELVEASVETSFDRADRATLYFGDFIKIKSLIELEHYCFMLFQWQCSESFIHKQLRFRTLPLRTVHKLRAAWDVVSISFKSYVRFAFLRAQMRVSRVETDTHDVPSSSQFMDGSQWE